MAEFQLYLFSPQNTQESFIPLFNTIYSEWKNSFSRLLAASGAVLDPDDFFRSDYVLAILSKNEVVALGTMTSFDLRLLCSRDHHYVKDLKEKTIEKLQSQNYNRILSVEYLNVLPNWRKNQSNIRWTEVLIGLTLTLMDESDSDLVIGTPRIDAKVADLCYNMKCDEIQEPIEKMKYPCAVIIFPKMTQRQFKNPITQVYVDQLYKNKIDTAAPLFFTQKQDLENVA